MPRLGKEALWLLTEQSFIDSVHTGTEAGEYRRRGRFLWRRLYERSSSGQEHTGMYASGAKKAAEIVSIFEPYHV